jgi:hypothetical protein
MAPATLADDLLADPDGIHAEAIAALPPLDPERRARIASLARSADPFTEKVRAVLRARR